MKSVVVAAKMVCCEGAAVFGCDVTQLITIIEPCYGGYETSALLTGCKPLEWKQSMPSTDVVIRI